MPRKQTLCKLWNPGREKWTLLKLEPCICHLDIFLKSTFFTSTEREVKDSRRSGMSQSSYFWYRIGHAESVGFRFYSAIWRSESRISWRYLEITSISLIYSLTFSRKKELLFWLSRGLNRLTCVTHQIRGDSKLRDKPIALLWPKVVRDMKNSYEIMH